MKTMQKIALAALLLPVCGCYAEKPVSSSGLQPDSSSVPEETAISSDWFTLHVPGGFSFKENNYIGVASQAELIKASYSLQDYDRSVLVWFVKAPKEDAEKWYDSYRITCGKMKLELSEKEETDAYRIYVFTPIMAKGQPLADQYNMYGIYYDGDDAWFAEAGASYRLIDFKDDLVNMMKTVEFKQ